MYSLTPRRNGMAESVSSVASGCRLRDAAKGVANIIISKSQSTQYLWVKTQKNAEIAAAGHAAPKRYTYIVASIPSVVVGPGKLSMIHRMAFPEPEPCHLLS